MILSFHPCLDSDAQIILGDRSLTKEDMALIQKANVIILPQTCPYDLYEVCANSNALIFPNYKTRFRYPGKVGQARLFKKLALPHPKTMCWQTVNEFKDAVKSKKNGTYPHKTPFLIKDNHSHEGDGVHIVKDKSGLAWLLDNMSAKENMYKDGFISQEFIPCSGNVLRAVILGTKIISYWKRPKSDDQVITTISRGAEIDHDWRPDLQEKGKALARIIAEKTEINLAAIDFIFPDSDNRVSPLTLEINYYFGRRGIGGIENYYRLLHAAVCDWLEGQGVNPEPVKIV